MIKQMFYKNVKPEVIVTNVIEPISQYHDTGGDV